MDYDFLFANDRVTARAGTVLTFARKFHRDGQLSSVTPQSLLIGMCQERAGVAGCILAMHDLDEEAIRNAIEPENPTGWSLPHFSNTCLAEATAIGHYYIGTEHLLLGLTAPIELAANRTLSACGLNPSELRHETLALLGHNPG